MRVVDWRVIFLSIVTLYKGAIVFSELLSGLRKLCGVLCGFVV